MSAVLPNYSDVKILVAGDLMLDCYWSGNAQRISPEAPVPIVLVNSQEERPGGAGNVARSITALGSDCTLVALTGDDDAAKKLSKLLENEHVNLKCTKDASARTVEKLRVLSRNQQLIRLDFEAAFATGCIERLTKEIFNEIESCDALILSDYKKGTLYEIQKIIDRAQSLDIKSFVDPKGNDFSKYKGVTAITPNQNEFNAVVGDVVDEVDIKEKGFRLLEDLELNALVITRSEKGVTLIESSGQITNIPARAKEVFDVTGAGDTFISVLAASHVAGSSIAEAVNIANAAASVVVGKLGAATVTKREIENELNNQSQSLSKILNKNDLIDKVGNLKSENKTIVMTNGCFDILHSGHVEFLSKAKQLADVLIVAINSDDSVKKLKGKSRPINAVQDRMKVLSSLRSIDWLIEFDEDTPIDLISEILPDILVKGGDYKVDDIVGGSLVLQNGGEVQTIEYVESKSTTEVISKIKTQG